MTLSQFMQREGWSVGRLAQESGLSHEGARLICNGKRRAGLKAAQAIAAATGGAVSVADLRPDLAAAVAGEAAA